MSGVTLIDSNSVGHANNAVATLSVGGYQVQAIFGVLNSIRDLRIKHPKNKQLCLWDGKAYWRYALLPEYKGKRNLDPNKKPKPYEIKAQALRDAYKLQVPDIIRGLGLLGVSQIIPTEDEADDLAGYLSGRYVKAGKKVLLVSRDHDWLQLVGESVSWFNPIDRVTVTGDTFQEYTGYAHAMQFLQEKALIGDNSDNIGGVAGIGPKASQLLLNHYGSIEALYLTAKDGEWEPPTKELKRYRKKVTDFIGKEKTEGMAIFRRNMELMNLIDAKQPKSSTLEVKKDPINVDGFLDFCEEFQFRSILNKQEQWLKPFMETK